MPNFVFIFISCTSCNQFAQQIDCLLGRYREAIFMRTIPCLFCNQFAQQIDCLPFSSIINVILQNAIPRSCKTDLPAPKKEGFSPPCA
jgi:hypothetical protein